MPNRKRLIECLLTALFVIFAAQFVCAQSSGAPAPSPSTDTASRLAKLEQQTAEAKSSADNAWMLTSSALVLMMTGPGLALFYGGPGAQEKRAGHHDAELRHDGDHHRAVGRSLATASAFGAGNGFIGGFQNLFLNGVGAAPDARLCGHHSRSRLS